MRYIRQMHSAEDSLNKGLGNYFGTKVKILVVVVGLIFTIVGTGIIEYQRYLDKKGEFILNENRYIIYDISTSSSLEGTYYYYEVDFEKNKAVYRVDYSEDSKRNNVKKIELKTDSLKNIVLQNTISENLEEESANEEYYASKSRSMNVKYLIRDYKGNVYYVQSEDDNTKMKNLLENSY